MHESPPDFGPCSAPMTANVEIPRVSVLVPHLGHFTESLFDALTSNSYLPPHFEQVYSKIGTPYSPFDKQLSKAKSVPQRIY